MKEAFSLFGADHLWALAVILTLAIGVPNWLKRPGNVSHRRPFEISLAVFMIVYGIAKPFIGVFYMGEAWEIWLPLHMCQIGNFLIAYALLSGKRGLLFETVYFWTYAGASMAMITPDLAYGWPDLNYIMFMVTHIILLVGVIYFSVVEGHRPRVSSIWKVFKLSFYMMLIMIPVNYIIGGEANYWYLRFPPVTGSVMDFLPEPPLHIPFVVLLAYVAFWLVYSPFLIADKIRELRLSRNAV